MSSLHRTGKDKVSEIIKEEMRHIAFLNKELGTISKTSEH